MPRRKKKRSPPLTPKQQERIRRLCIRGGYTVRYIAYRAVGLNMMDDSTEAQRIRSQVSGWMHSHDLRLSNWRNGRLPIAKQLANTAVRMADAYVQKEMHKQRVLAGEGKELARTGRRKRARSRVAV